VSLTISNEAEKINKGSIILKNVPLAPLTSFGTGGAADYLVKPTTLQQLKEVLFWARERNLPVTPLGGGTNVLVSDHGVEGLVIVTTSLNNYYVEGTLFVAQAGLNVDTAITLMGDHSLKGLELLGGLPGSIGGALFGNASANGVSMAPFVEWVDYLNYEGELLRYQYRAEDFAYKRSPFGDKQLLLWEIALRLKPTNNPTLLKKIIAESRAQREAKGQYNYPSAGCIFKNPPQGSAGYYIDQAGLKGKILDGAKVSPLHANFVITEGETTSSAIYELSCLMAQEVFDQFGITLEREIKMVGRW
jgi:UDP-N-acetylmuramate dehydrogenase